SPGRSPEPRTLPVGVRQIFFCFRLCRCDERSLQRRATPGQVNSASICVCAFLPLSQIKPEGAPAHLWPGWEGLFETPVGVHAARVGVTRRGDGRVFLPRDFLRPVPATRPGGVKVVRTRVRERGARIPSGRGETFWMVSMTVGNARRRAARWGAARCLSVAIVGEGNANGGLLEIVVARGRRCRGVKRSGS